MSDDSRLKYIHPPRVTGERSGGLVTWIANEQQPTCDYALELTLLGFRIKQLEDIKSWLIQDWNISIV